jgi:hypothetical protein
MVSRIDESLYNSIDSVITSKDNGRKIESLYASVREITRAPMCLSAALDLQKLEGSGMVLIATGFPVIMDDGSTSCETDGPLGAVRLIYGLSLLGIDTHIMTDNLYSKHIIRLLNSQELNTRISVARRGKRAERDIRDLLKKCNPDAIITVELPGRGYDGRYHDMRGTDITPYVAPLDLLVDYAPDVGARTIGIGDGGNEAGMGWISDTVRREIDQGDKIASKVKTDHLIVGSTSNWGAYGLMAALGDLCGKLLLCNGRTEENLFIESFSSGLIDGKLKKSARSVDGFDLEDNREIVRKLIELIRYDELACREE